MAMASLAVALTARLSATSRPAPPRRKKASNVTLALAATGESIGLPGSGGSAWAEKAFVFMSAGG
jgi:hypothetical protein